MANIAGIHDHNGENAERLAKGYASIDRKKIYPALFAHFTKAANEGRTLKVLDIGCGSGNDAYEIAKIGHEVVGVEPSDLRTIAIRDFSHENIEYRDGKLPALSALKEGETFDTVMLSAVLQYIDPAERVESLVKIANHMAPGAHLFVAYPSPPSRVHQFEITPETLQADLDAANKHLPPDKRIFVEGAPGILPDSRGRKSLDGRDLNFYSYVIRNPNGPKPA